MARLRASGHFDEHADRVAIEGYTTTDGLRVRGRLENCPPGTFVFRSSRQSASLVVSAVDSTGNIVHVLYRLHREPDGQILICQDTDPESPRYASIEDVVAAFPSIYAQSLLQREAGPASAYQVVGDGVLTAPAGARGSDADREDNIRYLMVLRSITASPHCDVQCTREDAERRLMDCPLGTFVIRGSESVPGDYTISVANGAGSVVHSRLSCLPTGFLLHDGHRYASLSEFLSYKRSSGVLGESLRTLAQQSARSSPPLSVSVGRTSPPPPGGVSGRASPPLPGVGEQPAAGAAGQTFSSPSPGTASPLAAVGSPTRAAPARDQLATPAASPGDESGGVRVCVVCLDNSINSVLLDCGHACCCLDCGTALTSCPLCRASIARCLRIFVA